MCEEFEWFNVEHVGEDSVLLPTENSAPKILEQFKYKPYTLEFRDEFTTGNKSNSLLIMSEQTAFLEDRGERAFCSSVFPRVLNI